MPPNNRPPDDLLETAISQLKAPLPDNLGDGLERDVFSRISDNNAKRGLALPWVPVMAAIVILVIGVSAGLLQGARYERLVDERFEEAYVATIHPIVGATAHSHGDRH